jgi:DNA-binding LacI/PurR family transcriptional regulator
MAKVTIREIASKLGISVATVSRAINPDTLHLVNESTRRRVARLVKSERYVPDTAAKRLVTGKSRNIVIFFRPQVASLFFDDYYSKMIAGAMAGVERTQYNLNLSIIKEERGGFDVADAIRGLDVAGAIIATVLGVFDISTKSIFGVPIPVIVLNQYKTGPNPGCFMVDNTKSAYDATAYLLSRGHRRIGFVRGSQAVKDAQDRYAGYRKAIADSRIAPDTDLEFQSNFLEESGRRAVRHYFSGRFEPPSAIFFSNDAVAMTAVNELRQIGVPCPEEVSVIGFDGIDAGRYTDPPLTTMLQPVYEMAREAVTQLIRNIEDGGRFGGSRYFIAKLIERGTVASYRGNRKGDAHVHGEGEADTEGAVGRRA